MTTNGGAAEAAPAGSAPSPAAPRHEPKACRSCGAPIYWGTNPATGRALPVDAEPCAEGTIQLYDRGGTVVAQVLKAEHARNVRDAAWALTGKHVLRTSHFARCPQAAQHRKPKGGARAP